MPEIDKYHDVLSAPMREVWPEAARLAAETDEVEAELHRQRAATGPEPKPPPTG